MKKRIAFIVAALSITLCGCGGYREINQGYLVTSLGVWKQNNTITFLIEALSSSDVSDKASERVVLSGGGESVSLAYKSLKESVVKPLYFEQLGAVVLQNISVQDLKEIEDIKPDVYLVETNDIKALFDADTPSGILGYDIISLIKTQATETKSEISNQLYNSQNEKFVIPTVNFLDSTLTIKVSESK